MNMKMIKHEFLCIWMCVFLFCFLIRGGWGRGLDVFVFLGNTFKIKMAHTANTDVHYFMITVFFYRCKPRIRSTLHFICFFNCQLAFIVCFCFLDAAGNSSSAVPRVSLPSFFLFSVDVHHCFCFLDTAESTWYFTGVFYSTLVFIVCSCFLDAAKITWYFTGLLDVFLIKNKFRLCIEDQHPFTYSHYTIQQ